MAKPIICLDFDGVIHRYRHGWRDGEIYDNVTEGFFEWAREATQHFYLYVLSSRSAHVTGNHDMKEWLEKQFKEWEGYGDLSPYERVQFMSMIQFVDKKLPAFLTIDDRALQFQGDWSAFGIDRLRKFKPWTEKFNAAEKRSAKKAHASRSEQQKTSEGNGDTLQSSEGVRGQRSGRGAA